MLFLLQSSDIIANNNQVRRGARHQERGQLKRGTGDNHNINIKSHLKLS